jgi:hypothetical protein
MMDDIFDTRFAPIILFGTALAMGICVIVLKLLAAFNIIAYLDLGLLLAVGLFCLGLAGIAGVETDDKPKKRKK